MEPDHTAPTTGRKAQWNPIEVSAFVNYLHEHRAEQGDARNFKLFVYAAAATAISSHCMSGPPKTGVMCKNKWTMVYDQSLLIINDLPPSTNSNHCTDSLKSCTLPSKSIAANLVYSGTPSTVQIL